MGISLRHLISLTYLHALGFASLCIAVISLGGYLLLDSAYLSQSMLLPDGILALLLLGMAVLGYAANRKRLLQASASLLLIVGAYGLLHGWLAPEGDQGLSLISGAPRMRDATALLFGLLAIGLLASRWGLRGRILAGALGLAAIGLGITSHLATTFPGLGDWSLGFNSNVSGSVNLFALCAGLALLCISLSKTKAEPLFNRVTLLTGLLCAFLSCLGWYLLGLQSYAADVRRSELLLEKLSTVLERTNEAQLRSIQQMAARWKVRGSLPTAPLWREETRGYLSEFSGFDTIALLDEQLQPKWLSSRSFFETDELYRLLTQRHLRNWLQALPQGQRPYAIAVNSRGIPSHSIIAMPLRVPSQPGWVLIASVDLSRTLGEIAGSELDGFHVRVFDGEHLLFGSSVRSEQTASSPISEQSVKGLADASWRLASYLDTSKKQPARYLPSLILLFGLTLSFMIMLSQRLRLQAVAHSRQLLQANQALELSLQRQASLQTLNQRIMQHSMDMLCSIDAQGRFTEINAACFELLGYTREELLGRPYIDLVLPEDRPRTLLTAEQAIEGHPTENFHNRYRHKDGSVVHLLWSFGWSADEGCFFGAAHNITSLMRAEAYLQEQCDILGMISTNQPLPAILDAICQLTESRDRGGLCSVLLVAPDGQRLRVGAAPSLASAYNQAMEGLAIGPASGSCSVAVLQQKLVVARDIASDPRWRDASQLALKHGLRSCWSFPLLNHDGHALGSLAIYHRQVSAPGDEQLQLMAHAGQLAAIAIEREQDRLDLQHSEQRFRSLYSFSPNAVVSLDREGRIKSLNQAAASLLGQSEELLGQHFSQYLQAEDLAQTERYFTAACAGEARRFEGRSNCPAGEVRDLNITLLPIVVDEAIVGVFAIARDISARKQAEQQLHATLRELERSNQDLQEFAFVASHDLQEPLRKIQAFSDRLTSHTAGLDERSRDYLTRIASAAARMQTLIHDLLAYSRVNSRGQALQTLDTEQVLDEVLRDLEASIESTGAIIQREPLPPIQGDPMQIRQLLQNLLSNAVKFHKDDQPPQIRIYAEQQTDREWSLCVEDQGIGFDEKYQARIFNPFQRLHGRQAYPGTGIGLAIVKKIVERHGAKVTASSKPGQGSVFRVTFPSVKRS